jgi:RNA polymerase sigma factor (sigma-70 family)
MASLTRDLRHVLAVAFRRPDTDAELIGRFVAARDEAAFAEIVHRHGPSVLRVCRSLLNSADADDAFQATFFVLARRAESLTNIRSLGGWLVGVAGRVARQLRRNGWRRAVVENECRSHDSADPKTDQNLRELNEELTQLPNRYRDPIVLCFLQDRTQDEAAAELGQSVRTLRRRLEKAKALLRLRLVRRGVAPAVLVPTTPLLISSAAAAWTATAAVQFLAGGVRSPAATLAKGFGMTPLIKLKVAAGLCAVIGTLTAVGVAQDVPKPVTGELNQHIPPVPSAELSTKDMRGTFQLHSDREGFFILAYGSDELSARVVMREAEYQLDQIHKRWFGTEPNPLRGKGGPEIDLYVCLGTNDRDSIGLAFDAEKKIRRANLTLSGSLETILHDTLPGQIARVVLAASLGRDVPEWVGQGLANTVVSADRQSAADSMARQGLNEGKGIKLKYLFQPSDSRPSTVGTDMRAAQAASVVRFLLWTTLKRGVPVLSDTPYINRLFQNYGDPSKELIRFVQLGMKDGWDTAAKTVYGFDSLNHVEERWIKWLMTEESKVNNPKMTRVLPPAVASDPARIPPVNLGK